jgi:hypothetical protein
MALMPRTVKLLVAVVAITAVVERRGGQLRGQNSKTPDVLGEQLPTSGS